MFTTWKVYEHDLLPSLKGKLLSRNFVEDEYGDVMALDVNNAPPHLFQPVTFQPLPRYPAVERDLSVLVGAEVGFREIAAGVEQLGIAELVSVDLIDVYEGGKIPEGKRSMTLRLRFQDRARTLTIDQVQAFGDNVLTFLRNKFGAELR